MNIPWAELLEILFKLLEDCGDSEDSRVSAMQDRIKFRFATTEAMIQAGVPVKDWRQTRKQLRNEVRTASPEELTAFATGGWAAVEALNPPDPRIKV